MTENEFFISELLAGVPVSLLLLAALLWQYIDERRK